MGNSILSSSIQYVKSVGNTRAKLLNRLGIFTIEDALYYFPRDYEDRTNIRRIIDLEDNSEQCFKGQVISSLVNKYIRKGMSIQKVSVKDDSWTATLVWFNHEYLKNVFKPGQRYIFYGKIKRTIGNIEIQNPVYDLVEYDISQKNTGRIIPIYPSTSSLSQNILRTIISNSLSITSNQVEEYISKDIRNKHKLAEINFCLNNIHFPENNQSLEISRRRLIFEELFILQLSLLLIKAKTNGNKNLDKTKKPKNKVNMDNILGNLSFILTDAQKKVLIEIEKDMESPFPMNRLVQGDVGSGKTIIAALALYKAVKSGYQGAIMVPTSILAQQQYDYLNEILNKHNIKCVLLTSNTSKKQKEEIISKISSGSYDIIVGTHALIEENVVFKNLGLVITDEQHRFGVRQRAVLNAKGDNADVLVMTATPIPRTLALILYGDLDISIIDQLPPGRKKIETYAVDNSMEDRINEFIKKQIDEGRQIYVVCPLIEESEEMDLEAVTEIVNKYKKEEFRQYETAYLHGKLKSSEKDEIIDRFRSGQIKILVSTTVIEVGVNVPNASVMIIENAERFGLAQLHQLRGRVGRGQYQSYCILKYKGDSKIINERMNIMKSTNDGFKIAEKDLELRGPGEFFGLKQHGLPELKIANLIRDMAVLKEAQQAAIEFIKNSEITIN
jgi:ATP-dependent DNA helicase RecG